MGKSRDRESLIREIANIIIHEIVAKHTNRPESVHFLNSEIIEYRSHAENMSKKHNWNNEDKKYIEEKALKIIKEKLSTKYSDIEYSDNEVVGKLKEIMKDVM